MLHNLDEASDDTSFKQTGSDAVQVPPREERGQMEAALRASEERYRMIVQTANEGIGCMNSL
jgi:PAS domain-containing protein